MFASLLGLALIGAIFAAVYFSPENVEQQGSGAITLAPGQVKKDAIEPSIPGSLIEVNLTFHGPPIDFYLMDQEWVASTLAGGNGGINLTQPFSYHAQWSALNVTGYRNLTLVADGHTRLVMVFDHSDNYYNDTVPNATAGDVQVKVHTRYLEEESKSLLLGYLAVTPSIILVGLTVGRQFQRWRIRRRRRRGDD